MDVLGANHRPPVPADAPLSLPSMPAVHGAGTTRAPGAGRHRAHPRAALDFATPPVPDAPPPPCPNCGRPLAPGATACSACTALAQTAPAGGAPPAELIAGRYLPQRLLGRGG